MSSNSCSASGVEDPKTPQAAGGDGIKAAVTMSVESRARMTFIRVAGPLTHIRTIVELIAATKTNTTRHPARLRPELVPTGQKISDRDYKAIPIRQHKWHREWNYELFAS